MIGVRSSHLASLEDVTYLKTATSAYDVRPVPPVRTIFTKAELRLTGTQMRLPSTMYSCVRHSNPNLHLDDTGWPSEELVLRHI